ncbi:MAG TPA: glycoside hydrolase family 38 C-terminal domain-containing protein [Flavisolibacter sp.]|jgi:alpha-mannosidase|nr:glycoside hydrolase family 38 C-terminal domain-containing protein [Flavisolibacter sp.]
MVKGKQYFSFRKLCSRVFFLPILLLACTASAQKAYFIDGYHGGVYGHYPRWYTQFIVDKLKENPFWKINLEIEPETWDSVLVREPAALKELQQLFADQSLTGRIEYVSPAYGQPYLYNISGESIIRHFDYGIKKVREYFPGAVFTTYSSEEPCFTSALPQILASFGYKYASLKNPNTCWGGYTRAYGGELVNWIGPDGTKLITVPRYATEGLLPNSTWQTEAWVNSPKYIKDALNYGIKNPVAMTLQDAGWRNGPWIGNGDRGYQPTEYITWRDYIANASIKTPNQDWKFSQEDLLVSLVWGSQILQKLSQQIKVSENKLVMAEKLAALSKVYHKSHWPQTAIDEAWRTLMLAQHHDCWIVPYNGKPGNNWADKVAVWTGVTNRISDSITRHAFNSEAKATNTIKVYNTTGSVRNELVKLALPMDSDVANFSIVDDKNKEVLTQVLTTKEQTGTVAYFKAKVPALGYSTYKIVSKKPAATKGAQAAVLVNGHVVLENDFYKLVIDKSKGGTIKSLIAKKLGNKEMVDAGHERGFNELRGNFYNNGGFHSSTESPITVTIVENGPAVVKAEIKGELLSHPYTQTITLKQGDRKIDCHLTINWKENIGIGSDYKQKGGLDAKDYTKPFYDDSQKLLALFPVNFSSQAIYKDAPFDVTESKLENTFFTRWDSIKHNLMVNWVDVYDAKNDFGLALFTDHTTTYTHGENFPFGLNVQYSGAGLWGRNHTITGPTEISYALVPHAGKWDKARISTEAVSWNEPLVASTTGTTSAMNKSLVDVSGTGFQVTTVLVDGADLLVRLFNAEGDDKSKKVFIGGSASGTELIELNGTVKKAVRLQKIKSNSVIHVAMPRFGLRTIRLKNFKGN